MKQTYLQNLLLLAVFILLQNPLVSQCAIWDVFAEAHECDDEGQFLVDIEFNSGGVGVEGFSIVGNGTDYGDFDYGQTFYTVGPIDGNGQELEFVIIDNQFPDCSDFTVLEAPICSSTDCQISDLIVDTGECNGDENYNLFINFNYQDAPNEHVDVIYQGNVIGFFNINNLPILIENFDDNGENFPVIVVCFNDTPSCCAEVEFESPCPNNDECEIWDVIAEAHECDDDGNFLVDIAFNSNNTGGAGFSIVGNGNNYGSFGYGSTFYTIGPISGNGQDLEFIISDNEVEGCNNFTVLEAPDCEGGSCEIFDVEVETGLCNDEGQYDVQINFEVANTTNEFFDLWMDGEFVDFFALSDLPIIIENFESESDFPLVEICINDNPDCCTAFEFEAPNCDGGNCEIWDLNIEAGECDDDGNYHLWIDFNFANVTNEHFDVIYQGEVIGFFNLEDLPIVIENFEDDGEAVQGIAVCINDTPDCCAEIEFESPCFDGDCHIFEEIVEAHECDDFGQFLLDIAFEYTNVGIDGFSIYSGDYYLGSFDYGEPFYTVGPLNTNGGMPLHFIIVDNENETCHGFVAIDGIDCGSEDFVWPGDANSDFITNNFDVLNLGLAFEFEGIERVDQTIDWGGWLSEDWDEEFANDVNLRHADCDGNGVVHWDDLAAIGENYELIHGFVDDFVQVDGTEEDPALFVDLPAAEPIIAGQQFSAPIHLGNATFPIENVYGLAFTLKFDTDIINPSSVEITFDENWMGNNNVNVMTFQKNWSEMGEIDVAITKIDQNNVSGFGQIASFIGVIDDLVGKELTQIEVVDVKAIGNNEQIIPLRTPTLDAEIISSDNNLNPNNQVEIFPNPANDLLNIRNDFGLPIEHIIIQTVDGKRITSSQSQSVENQIDISNLLGGVYLIELEIGGKRYFQKLVKM